MYLVLFFAASGYYFCYSQIPAFKHLADTAELFGLSWTTLPIMFMFFYERIGWKWFNPDLDLAGYWDFVEDQFELLPDGAESYDYSAWGHIKIAQNTAVIRIVDGLTHTRVILRARLIPSKFPVGGRCPASLMRLAE
jgi:hypothetical protein